ncbi:MAG: DUF2252 domain-containing protein [Anaerolineales bacterium]|nr:DUF2252 domain-containing protein [Anaerolineales bacterium]
MPANKDNEQHPSLADRKELIKTMREQAPRKSHGEWVPAHDRPDPISLLQAQDHGRIERLLPIKYGRMLESPFAFLRGSAVVMSADLAPTPNTGLHAILCGDAHLSNFGIFATPERRMVFDINDFDEAYPGPWEWDLKRLAASAVVAGRGNGFSEKKCRGLAAETAKVYAYAMDKFSQAHVLDVWYYHVNVDDVLKVFEKASKQGEKNAQKLVRKAGRKTHQQTLEKLTSIQDGKRRIISEPPLMIPFRELGLERFLSEVDLRRMTEQSIMDSWSQYLESLPDERRYLLNKFRIKDAALRVGGVGSVGTRCIIVLLESEAEGDALILQLKEAGPSVLEAYVERKITKGSAERVVTGQRLMQATSDIFLGWHTSRMSGRDYYWRQLKDMKGSADVAEMDYDSFKSYMGVCAWCLARAHARTGDETSISGYIGKNDDFTQAISQFAVAYADQTERDYQALVEAVKSGRITAETGI